LKDCLDSGSVEKAAKPQAGKAAARGSGEASAEAVSILLRRLGAPEDRVGAMARDMIAVVESPMEEAVIYANARADSWGETTDGGEKGASVSASPLPVFPVRDISDGEPAMPPGEDLEDIKARALAEAEAAAG
jgi:hypothetical protein